MGHWLMYSTSGLDVFLSLTSEAFGLNGMLLGLVEIVKRYSNLILLCSSKQERECFIFDSQHFKHNIIPSQFNYSISKSPDQCSIIQSW